MGTIYKGVIYATDGRLVRIRDTDGGASPPIRCSIDADIGDTVVYVVFPDATGIVLSLI